METFYYWRQRRYLGLVMLKTALGVSVEFLSGHRAQGHRAALPEQTGLQLHYGSEVDALVDFSPASQTPAKPVSPAQLGVTEEQQICFQKCS